MESVLPEFAAANGSAIVETGVQANPVNRASLMDSDWSPIVKNQID
ncbi:hypothetical protein [Actinoplanes campanulatus]|nr:hypothetical protein [Actinoplanes capillaceus]